MNGKFIFKLLYSWPVLLLIFFSLVLPPLFIDTDSIFPMITPEAFFNIYFMTCGLFLTFLWLKKIKQTTWGYILKVLIIIIFLVSSGFYLLAEQIGEVVSNTDIWQLLIMVSSPFIGYFLALVIRRFKPVGNVEGKIVNLSLMKGITGILFLAYGPILILDGYWNHAHSLDDFYYPFSSPDISDMLLGLVLISLVSLRDIKFLFVSIGKFFKNVYFWFKTDHYLNLKILVYNMLILTLITVNYSIFLPKYFP